MAFDPLDNSAETVNRNVLTLITSDPARAVTVLTEFALLTLHELRLIPVCESVPIAKPHDDPGDVVLWIGPVPIYWTDFAGTEDGREVITARLLRDYPRAAAPSLSDINSMIPKTRRGIKLYD